MKPRRDDARRLITFRMSKRAIRSSLLELSPLVDREAHGALTTALASTQDPSRVRLRARVAGELLRVLRAAAKRHKKARTPDAAALLEATDILDVAIRFARNP